MKKENIETFFALLRAGLWGEADANLNLNANDNHFEGVEWEKIYKLAQEQSVQGLVLQGIEWFKNHNLNPDLDLNIPKVLLMQWIGEVQVIEQRNKEMNAFIADLIEKLQKNDIYALLVKGQGIALSYEKPLWRSCGDVDFFLSEDNYLNAKSFLMPMAEKVEQEWITSKHLGMTIDGWTVELHGSLRGSLSSKVNSILDEIKQDTFLRGNVRSCVINRTQVFLLGIENDIIYVFCHFLNHFYKGGIGLRQICDWCRLLWTYKDSLDYGLLESRIRKMRLMSEWKAFGAFAVDYLGMPSEKMPMYSPDDKWKRKAEKLCAFIMEVGNFGHNRDMRYFEKYPYLIRKCVSMGRRISDLINHARIFPLDSLCFSFSIMVNGVKSTMRGE